MNRIILYGLIYKGEIKASIRYFLKRRVIRYYNYQ
jgi:hypothetical protein